MIRKATLRLFSEVLKPGATVESVAGALGLTQRYVRQQLRVHRCKLPSQPAVRPPLLAPFTEESLAMAYRRFVGGDGLREVAADHGVDACLLRRRFEANGYPKLGAEVAQRRRSQGAARSCILLTDAEAKNCAAMNKRGMDFEDIGRAIGVTGSVVARSIRRLGIEPIKAWAKIGAKNRKVTDEQIVASFVDYCAGSTLVQVATKLGVSHVSLLRRMTRLGLPRRKPGRRVAS